MMNKEQKTFDDYGQVRPRLVFDFDQYRKMMLAKAVCIDHEIMEICFLEGIYKDFLPFLNAVLIPPQSSTSEPVFKCETKYPFEKEMMIKWDQRFPSVSTYMIYPCRGFKLIDIDVDNDCAIFDPDDEEVHFMTKFVEALNEMNAGNIVIDRDNLKAVYGTIRRIGDRIVDALTPFLDFEQVFYTGRGFQIWAEYKEDTVRTLMKKHLICESNDPMRKAQRLFSPLFMGIDRYNKAHMQCCVPYDDWNKFKYSNPAFFTIENNELRKLAMDYNEALMVSRHRGEGDYQDWWDQMEKKQKEVESKIFKLLKIDE